MRKRTRQVSVGGVPIGGDSPVKIQSMTTTKTSDTEGTAAQIGRLEEAGCEIVRVAVADEADARAIAAKFENRVRAILPIPFDKILDAGGEIDFDALAPATRAAYQTAAAAISHGLADTKEK